MTTDLEQHHAELTVALIGNLHDGDFDITGRISDASRITPRLALDIYRNNTRGTRIRSLEIIHPACRAILGDDTFHAIAADYVAADTVGVSDLNNYGGRFSHHLGDLAEAGRLPGDYAYLQDLARLEYSYHAAYYADDDPVFDYELFERTVTNGEPVYFEISASLRRLASEYPVYDIWQLNRPARAEDRTAGGEHEVKAVEGTQFLLVHRVDEMPVVLAIVESQYRLLEAFANGLSLQAVIDDVDRDVDVVLPGLIANRWIVGTRHDG